MTRQEALATYRRHGLLLAQMSVREDVADRLAALERERDAAHAKLLNIAAAWNGWANGGDSAKEALDAIGAALG